MKLRLMLVVVLLCFAGCVSGKKDYVKASDGPIPLPQARAEIIKYYDGGDYLKDAGVRAKTVAEAADKALADKVKYPAVVMVVEDVLLSTYPARRKQGFSDNSEARRELDSHVILSALPAVEPSVQLFESLLARNIPVFLVSYQPEDLRISVMENLSKSGFSGWKKLFMKPSKYPEDRNFCEEVRRGLVDSGFNIIATVGVLAEDVAGEQKGVAVLYPNYIYDRR
ncbi:HAD family acid phosphatase [Maridesulfovibrio sp. FT414]|uniref:HAD family acid phosphatase n=1 Tax=Maridesulfovibrio sp. FT414 TaxID=2979469 RepID=UPI003D80170F